jgi:putative hydrolases of HD superfamily
MDQNPEELFNEMTRLSALCLQYGETFRVTTYPDGQTLESDTDHSFMLGMMACVLRDMVAPELDRGKLAEYALIHDFVEVYAGDTATLGMIDKSEKEERERKALGRIQSEYDNVFPWIAKAIGEYDSLAAPEARFIKVLDKIMPTLTQVQNEGEVFERLKVSKEDIMAAKDVQREWIQKTATEWPLLIALYEEGLKKIYKLPYFQ